MIRQNETRSGAAPLALWLASASPRRASLLRGAGIAFRVMRSRAIECPRRSETPGACARRHAAEKAREVAARLPARPNDTPCLVLGADTVVAIEGRILGKPRDAADARRMLRLLSGKPHQVWTGVCLLRCSKGRATVERAWVSRTEVRFRALTPSDIAAYVAGGEPMDKAGAYAIQGGAAGMVASIRGSYTNVVGLPLSETIEALRAARP